MIPRFDDHGCPEQQENWELEAFIQWLIDRAESKELERLTELAKEHYKLMPVSRVTALERALETFIITIDGGLDKAPESGGGE
jgi:hypothetical protein